MKGSPLVSSQALISLEVAVALALSLANAAYFAAYVRKAETRARRIGAGTLLLLSLALALEAAHFLANEGPRLLGGSALLLVVRTALLLAIGLISVLVWRRAAADEGVEKGVGG